MGTEEELTATIAQALEVDHQYVERVEAWDTDRMALVRKCGRKAGRVLGWKVRTFLTDPAKRDDGRVKAWVVVIESTPEDEKRLEERALVLMNEAWKDILPPQS